MFKKIKLKYLNWIIKPIQRFKCSMQIHTPTDKTNYKRIIFQSGEKSLHFREYTCAVCGEEYYHFVGKSFIHDTQEPKG